jgi:hypothetical protein
MTFNPYIEMKDPRIHDAIAKLQELIIKVFPAAKFSNSWLDDPEGLHIRVIVPVEDPEEVFNLVADQLLHYQVDEGLPV